MAEEMKQCCACRHKETERADDLQHDLTKRLNRAIGQLNGVKDMIADNRYCGDVLVQLAAAESASHRRNRFARPYGNVRGGAGARRQRRGGR